jgi:hypothetical protein
VGEGRTGEPAGEPQENQRLTVSQAATALGITEGAVRSRIKRGTLTTTKEGGTVFVLLGDGTSKANQTPNTDVPTDQSELIETLREQVNYLRKQLDVEREASRRKDHLLAAALERIPPAIEAPQDTSSEAPGGPETGAEMPMGPEEPQEAREKAQEAAQPRSWWRRLLQG